MCMPAAQPCRALRSPAPLIYDYAIEHCAVRVELRRLSGLSERIPVRDRLRLGPFFLSLMGMCLS